jgi:putative endonuclease
MMFNKNFRKEPTEKQKIGEIGENCACDYLKKKGFSIVERNYLKKWGEIDIVAKNGKKLHFIEVKSVSRETFSQKEGGVIRETRGGLGEYRPEDNIHPWKLQRLSRVIQSYLLDRQVPDNVDWQFDLATVYIDTNKRLSRVSLLEDIVL